MGNFSQHLKNSLLATLAGLPVGCMLGGLLFAAYALLVVPGGLRGGSGVLLLIVMAAAYFAFLPSLIYGAPLYALFAKRGWANLPCALAIGVAPGVLVYFWEPSVALFIFLFGGCISVATHFFAKHRWAKIKRIGANNSSKPMPLRGTA